MSTLPAVGGDISLITATARGFAALIGGQGADAAASPIVRNPSAVCRSIPRNALIASSAAAIVLPDPTLSGNLISSVSCSSFAARSMRY